MIVLALFRKDEVVSSLTEAGRKCARPVQIYLIGGGAMALRGEKDATKDVDLILGSEDDAETLVKAFIGLGYRLHPSLPLDCAALTDAIVLERGDGLRIDVFVAKVCNGLALSENMVERSDFFGRLCAIELHICSREDIFLLKSVTERSRDLDDMYILYKKGLDRDLIFRECTDQNRMVTPPNEKIWESFLLVKIEEMERRFGIGIPWKRELRSRQNIELATRYMLPAIARGNGTVKKIATALNLSERIVCHHISELERDGLIQVERGSKPHRINIRSEQDSGTCLFQFPSQCCAHAVEHVEGGVGPS